MIQKSLLLLESNDLKFQTLSYSSLANTASMSPIIKELPTLLSENDLHVAQLTLLLLGKIARYNAQCLPMVDQICFSSILALIKSPLLQAGAQDAMLELIRALVDSNYTPLGHQRLLTSLITPAIDESGSNIDKHGKVSLAKCVAAVVVKLNEHDRNVLMNELIQYLTNENAAPYQRTFSLLAFGEIGKLM